MEGIWMDVRIDNRLFAEQDEGARLEGEVVQVSAGECARHG